MKDYAILPLGDQALTLSFGNTIDDDLHHALLRIEKSIRMATHAGLKDIVVAYSSLTIFFDGCNNIQFNAHEYWNNVLEAEVRNLTIRKRMPPDPMRIPVCYHGVFAPDMEYVCRQSGLSSDEVISLHTTPIYSVYMIGFLPGFPYMGTVDERLRVRRKETPRKKILPGSVGLAGWQTGIYPSESPGGWQIIGRTPVRLFDRNASAPALFSPGDSVQFYAITETAFSEYEHAHS